MKKISAVGLVIMMMFFVGGCALNDGSTQQQAPTPVSILSIYNGNADADADVNLVLNSVQVNISPITYKTFLDYFKLDPGLKAIKFTNPTNNATVIDTSFTLREYKAYSLFLTKKKNSTKPVSIFVADEGTLVTNTNTMIRFINLSPDAPNVDIKFVGDVNIFASNVPFMLMTPYQEVAPLDATVQITKSSDGTVLQTFQLSSTGSGYHQTIILSGYVSSPNGGLNTLTTKLVHD